MFKEKKGMLLYKFVPTKPNYSSTFTTTMHASKQDCPTFVWILNLKKLYIHLYVSNRLGLPAWDVLFDMFNKVYAESIKKKDKFTTDFKLKNLNS